MTRPAARRGFAVPTVPLSEEQWQQTVIDYATLKQWRHYHTRNSRRSVGGFPDLVLIRGRRLVVAELKKEDGKPPTAEQRAWLESFAATGAEAYVWRPSDLQAVLEVLG